MQDDTLEKIAFLFLGWLLGLLAPVIVNAINTRRENKLGREAIKTELASLKIKLVIAYDTIEEHQGTMTRQGLEWITNQLSTASVDTEAHSVSEALKKLLDAPDDQLNQYFSSKKSPAGKSLTLQKYATPLLDARVSALWSFDTASQRTLLEIRSALDITSEIVDRARHFANLTFQKLENGNHALAVENVEGCYTQYALQAKRIVALIARFDPPPMS
jgi:hypothetical protein